MSTPARAGGPRLSRLARRAMNAAANAATDVGRGVPSGSQTAVALLLGSAIESPEFAHLIGTRGVDLGEIADRLSALPVVPEADPEIERRRYRAYLASVTISGIAECLDLLAALILSPYIDDEARAIITETGLDRLVAAPAVSEPSDAIDGTRTIVGPATPHGREKQVDRVIAALSNGDDIAVIGPQGVGKEAIVAAATRRAGFRVLCCDAAELAALTPAARSARLTAIARALLPGGVIVIDHAETPTIVGLPPHLPLITLSVDAPQLTIHPTRRAARRLMIAPLSAMRAVAAVTDWAEAHQLPIEESIAAVAVEIAAGIPGALPGSAIGLLRSAIDLVGVPEAIDRSAIEIAAAERGGLPLAIVSPSERARVRSFEALLAARVVGQPEAVAAVGAVYRRRAIDLDLRSGPTAFLFSGPTGVGKTEMAKAIAEASFGDPRSLLRLDMGEFQHDHEIARLVGAPQGYVGYGDPGQLTAFLKERPRAVLLFDEIEKAHPAMVRLLIGLLDTGLIHSGKGEAVSAKESTVVLTSNIGGAGGRTYGGIGFGERPTMTDRHRAVAVDRAVEGHFPPEFRNRLDAVIPFRAIDAAAMSAIFELRAARLRERLQRWQVQIEIDPALVAQIVEQAINSGFGGREIARRFDTLVADRIGGAFIEGAYQAGTVYRLELDATTGSRLRSSRIGRRRRRLA